MSTEIKIELVYAGRRETISGKTMYKYYRIDNDQPMGFDKKLIVCPVGVVLSATQVDENTFRGPYNYVRGYHDTDKIGEWIAMDRIEGDRVSQKRKMNKIPKNSYDDSIDSLRRIYKQLSPSQRMRFISRMIYHITK